MNILCTSEETNLISSSFVTFADIADCASRSANEKNRRQNTSGVTVVCTLCVNALDRLVCITRTRTRTHGRYLHSQTDRDVAVRKGR